MKRIRPIYLLLSFFILPVLVKSQNLDKVLEFLTVYPNKKATLLDSTVYPAKAIFTPVITYAPETSLSLGLGMKGLFKMKGSGPETRTSNIPATIQYTIENKYLFFSSFDIFFPQERYMLTGNIRIQSFPSLFFGIGQNTPKSNKEDFAYQQILLEPIFLKNFFIPYLFVGGGIRYNQIGNVKAYPNGLLDLSKHLGAKGSTSLGFQLAMIYDSRDNILNAEKGIYVRLTHGFYGDYLGLNQNFELTRFDLRYYVLASKKYGSILAFQFLTHLSHRDTPLLELGRLGGGELMRGYFSGRYTDRHLMASQIELRQKISPRWGFVVFAGVGNVAPSIDEFIIQTLRPSVGLGARFLIDKKENLNLRLDFGVGQEKCNYYFKVAEAF